MMTPLKLGGAFHKGLFHIAHKGRAGGMFDRDGSRGQIIQAVEPRSGEAVIEKQLPNAFAGTELAKQLEAAGKKDIILGSISS